jgi:hypothetical protein
MTIVWSSPIWTVKNALNSHRLRFLAWKRRWLWTSVTLGVSSSAKDLADAIPKSGYRFAHGAVLEVVKRIPLASNKTKLKLVIWTLADLGFTEPVSDMNIVLDRAKDRGLRSVPAEAAPLLRIRYRQPSDGCFQMLVIAMNPVSFPDVDLFPMGNEDLVFTLNRNPIGDPSIGAAKAKDYGGWQPCHQFVFARE